MNTYRVLPSHLHGIADATALYLANHVGVPVPKIELEINPEIDFRPTLHSIARDKHIICAEIVDSFIMHNIEQFVPACKNHSIPVKLYIAVAKGQFQQIDLHALKFAKENGVAIVEISPPNHGTIITSPPLSLSLGGLRVFRISDFPTRYRENVQKAIETFRQGNPVKGCSEIYDEIESLTRRVGLKCAAIAKGLINSPNFDWNTENWANIIEFLKNHLDVRAVHCPNLKKQLFSRIAGLTEYRNESGHKVRSTTKLILRDRQLRTRFESAMDVLVDLIKASAPLKLR
ncbi:MAG: hypothetical protein NTY86_16850 [Deltaproteobacteria bacterium]|nr:hypothetical protein [Deltaproteobacteria bacterium]